MKVTSLVDNISGTCLNAEHGLSLLIELEDGKKILFDMGQGHLFALNASSLGLRLSDVDIAVISHGHYDHGGGLGFFLEENANAPVYISSHAFEPHYSLRGDRLRNISIDSSLADNPRIVRCGSQKKIDNNSILFSDISSSLFAPSGNRLLFGPDKETNDDFKHEQSLILRENDKTVLIAGCSHRGIANIVKRAMEITGRPMTHVLSGMHLVKSGLSAQEERTFIKELSHTLVDMCPDCQYITMHCTGIEQYAMLKDFMQDRISYLTCGKSINL